MKLREVFQSAKRRTLPRAWLFLPVYETWTIDTDGVFLDGENEEQDEDEIRLAAKRDNLLATLDNDMIEQVVDWADRLAHGEDDSARLDVFQYYFRFDGFPDRLGAPDPPPVDEIIRRLDREFYDSLGAERGDTKCRREGCSRGATNYSVFCRVHQFEQVKKKPCPFQH